MNVASLELTKELYELSGWGWDKKHARFETYTNHPADNNAYGAYPAYDLGFLLRKIYSTGISIHTTEEGQWGAICHEFRNKAFFADTPENAVAELSIELFKQGILRKDV